MSSSVIPVPSSSPVPEGSPGPVGAAPSEPGTETPTYESIAQSLRPVSPRLIRARYIGNLAWWIPFIVVGIVWNVLVAWLGWPPMLHLLSLLFYVIVAQSVLLMPRRTRALGYLTREDDVLFRSGLMFRSMTVVPYGRVQDIEITEGPIERKFGLSTLAMKSAGGVLGNVTIPGLERAESERIRDLVTREANQKMAAL
ncbi:MAG: PH domain-containing protein [Dermabacter sp.]|nr:PH domain-containing protein [Dermabacter sp.]